MAESSLYDANYFLTLTYAPEHLPSDGSVHLKHLQKFHRKLRKKIGPTRYYQIGEYGKPENGHRPHYHLALFNTEFEDLVKVENSRSGADQFVSPLIHKVWPQGRHRVGELNFESAAYLARYITKKITGPHSDEHYQGRTPEFSTMSRRPGIGRDWLRQFEDDVYPSDSVLSRGHLAKPPTYFDRLYEASNPEGFAAIRDSRALRNAKHKADQTEERLAARAQVARSRLGQLNRE